MEVYHLDGVPESIYRILELDRAKPSILFRFELFIDFKKK